MDLQKARAVKAELGHIFMTRVRGTCRRRFAMGLAIMEGQQQYAIAVRAPSPEDLDRRDLAVIRDLAGSDVDVRYTGEIRALAGGAASSPPVPSRRLTIGLSIGHYDGTTGSLGFFARRKADGVIGLVSCNHVLAASDRGKSSDDILHPTPMAGGVRSRDTVARLNGGYPRLNRRHPRVDCAFAPLLDGVDYDPRSLGAWGSLSPHPIRPEENMNITKIGGTTGLTHGRIPRSSWPDRSGIQGSGSLFSAHRSRFSELEISRSHGKVIAARWRSPDPRISRLACCSPARNSVVRTKQN